MEEKKKEHELSFKTDKNGEWRWRLIHTNGKCVAAASEGYCNKDDCISNATKVLDMDRVKEEFKFVSK